MLKPPNLELISKIPFSKTILEWSKVVVGGGLSTFAVRNRNPLKTVTEQSMCLHNKNSPKLPSEYAAPTMWPSSKRRVLESDVFLSPWKLHVMQSSLEIRLSNKFDSTLFVQIKFSQKSVWKMNGCRAVIPLRARCGLHPADCPPAEGPTEPQI